MLDLNGTGKGAVRQFQLYHPRKTFIVEGVDEVLVYFLSLKKLNKNLRLNLDNRKKPKFNKNKF